MKAVSRSSIGAALVLCAATLLAYSNSFHTGFPLDNGLLIQEQRIFEATRQNVDLILNHTYWWPTAETGLYRPLTSLSFLFNYAILGNGEHPEGYHWINLLLHAGNVMLAFALALRVVRRLRPAFFIAGLWAVHPVLVESVTNIVGRADLLAGTCVLGGLLIYLKATETQGWRRLAYLAGLMALTAVGVFSKENAITVVGVIALYEFTWWKERGRPRDLLEGAVAMLPPIVVYLNQRSFVLSSSFPALFPFVDNPITGAGFWLGRLTALQVMGKYLALILWPVHLSSDYSYAQVLLVAGTASDWMAWTLVCALGAFLLLQYRRNPPLFFFGLFAFGTFLPASNLLFNIGTIMAERLLYLPALGLIACLVLAVFMAAERIRMPMLAPAVLILAMCLFAARTWKRNPDWQDNVTLAEAAVRTSPLSFKTHMLLARALNNASPQHSDLERSIAEGERAVALLDPVPDFHSTWSAYRELAGYYLFKGDDVLPASAESARKQAWLRAIQLLRRALAILDAYPSPVPTAGRMIVPVNSVEVYRTLAGAYLRVSDPANAYAAAVHSRDLNPGSVEAYRTIGKALRALGRDDDAITALTEGQLLTGDSSLSAEVILIFEGRPDRGCTLRQGTYGPEPDPACPAVRQHICDAVGGAIHLLRRSQGQEQAELLMKRAMANYGCAADPLRRALADPL